MQRRQGERCSGNLFLCTFLAIKVYELAKQAWLGLGDSFNYGVQVGALAVYAWPFFFNFIFGS